MRGHFSQRRPAPVAAADGNALLAELERRAVPAGAVRTVGEALTQASAQVMLLPGTGGTHAGLRTVAFRSSAWLVVAQLGAPPELGAGAMAETKSPLPSVPPGP